MLFRGLCFRCFFCLCCFFVLNIVGGAGTGWSKGSLHYLFVAGGKLHERF